MRMTVVSICLALAAAPATRADEAMRPGLWEQRVVSTVVDDNRKSAFSDAMAASQRQNQALMKSMAGNDPHFGRDGATRECVSAERARQYSAAPAAEPGCQQSVVHRDGGHLVMQNTCGSEGMRTKSSVEVVAASELIRIRTDTTMTLPNGEAHTVRGEIENRFLGADCGALKPEPRAASKETGANR